MDAITPAMLTTWKRERRVRQVLRSLARQRVGAVLQPGNVWVIELALQRNDDVEADLQTCLMRGWVEVLHPDMPARELTDFLEFPSGPMFTKVQTNYRLTDGGWAALNRAHAWRLVNTLLAAASLVAAIVIYSISSTHAESQSSSGTLGDRQLGAFAT